MTGSTGVCVAYDVPLGPLTTLGVGGTADAVAVAGTTAAVKSALDAAGAVEGPLHVLGEGSNVIVSDRGLRGTTLRVTGGAIRVVDEDDAGCLVSVDAGVDWDDLVAWSVERELSGIELLSGIPGTAGAAPVQNVSAYGQVVRDVLSSLVVVDRSGAARELTAAECGLEHRHSKFKDVWRDRFVITEVVLRLRRGPAAGEPAYRDLVRHFAASGADPADVRERRAAVLAVRRAKSMVRDAADPYSRSAGSFFVGPRLPRAAALDVLSHASGRREAEELLRWYSPGDAEEVRVPAARVLLAAGFRNGDRWGDVCLSPKHVLAIVNLGKATATDVWAVANHVRQTVVDRVGVWLEFEPTFVGEFPRYDPSLVASLEHASGETGEPAWLG